jgi:hypothetical protein
MVTSGTSEWHTEWFTLNAFNYYLLAFLSEAEYAPHESSQLGHMFSPCR